MNTRIFLSLVLACTITSIATAEVRLPAIISDNMVIQADANIPIWGWAEPNETVVVSLNSQRKTAVTNTDGKWMICLDPLKAGDTTLEMTIAGMNTISIKNILVGQVWLASGQSNMQWPVKETIDADREVKSAFYPEIRLFSVTRTTAFSPAEDCNGRWVECSPQTIGDFSAVAYFFGRNLHQKLKQPVGLINSSWNGTIAETWISQSSLRANPDFSPILQRHEEMIKKYFNAQADYDEAIRQWQKDVNEAKKGDASQPAKKPTAPAPLSPNGASLLFNGMIAPVIPFTIKGVIWYQGESNVNRAKQYQTLFPALICDWRTHWQQGDFPFLFVQLANFKVPSSWYDPIVWAELREAQVKTLSTPNTGMAVTIDIGDANNIHPRNKQEVGRRLALLALAKTYGYKGLQYSGPMYKSMKIKGNKIVLEFDADCTSKDKQLNGFTIAGADQKFIPAQAKIQTKILLIGKKNLSSQKVVVWNPNIKKPVAVRYAWSDNPENCTLYGETGLPASPFRTDDWPGVTDNNK